MNRTEVIQRIIDQRRAGTYLEIGVAAGDNFFRIKAKRKIAVDPNFTFSNQKRRRWTFVNLCNRHAVYHDLTSDDYFASTGTSASLDVVFVDGQHTHEQSLRDVTNALGKLTGRGVIVVHDCNPPHAAAACRVDSLDRAAALHRPDWTDEWCGDVWKTICYLRSHRRDLRVFVLDCDYGMGIITRGEPDGCLNLTEDELNRMTYDELARDRTRLLNLKDEAYLSEFLETT